MKFTPSPSPPQVKQRNTTEILHYQQIKFQECPIFLVFVIFNGYPFLNMPWSSVYCYYIFFSIVISARADKSKTCQHFPHIVHLPDFFTGTRVHFVIFVIFIKIK
jgi:hypothetical protein